MLVTIADIVHITNAQKYLLDGNSHHMRLAHCCGRKGNRVAKQDFIYEHVLTVWLQLLQAIFAVVFFESFNSRLEVKSQKSQRPSIYEK